jgi:uncharacterized membrane protein
MCSWRFASRWHGWQSLNLRWWIWLVIAAPALLLTADLVMARRGRGFVRSRMAALVPIGILIVANFSAVAILVFGIATINTRTLSGSELLISALVVWIANVLVFGRLFWELDGGGPMGRRRGPRRSADHRFPQDDDPAGAGGWHPRAWDYLYVSLTNSIAFSPTDTMPLSLRLKATMALESAIAGFTVLLVLARAVTSRCRTGHASAVVSPISYTRGEAAGSRGATLPG